jgi:hypothetical protein
LKHPLENASLLAYLPSRGKWIAYKIYMLGLSTVQWEKYHKEVLLAENFFFFTLHSSSYSLRKTWKHWNKSVSQSVTSCSSGDSSESQEHLFPSVVGGLGYVEW